MSYLEWMQSEWKVRRLSCNDGPRDQQRVDECAEVNAACRPLEDRCDDTGDGQQHHELNREHRQQRFAERQRNAEQQWYVLDREEREESIRQNQHAPNARATD